MKILVIEDDPTVGQFVKRGFEEQRWGVDLVANGDEGEARAISEEYDVVILDMRLPGKSGAQVLHDLRARGFERPVLILTAQDAVDSKVETLRAGADDYVTKPFGAEELLARVRAGLRRSDAPSPPSEPLTRGDLVIDRERFRVVRGGAEVRLTPKEFELLTYFAQHPGRVLTHRTILKAIWGPNAVDQPEHLRVLVGALRKKIEVNSSAPKYILTEPWVGYRFADD